MSLGVLEWLVYIQFCQKVSSYITWIYIMYVHPKCF